MAPAEYGDKQNTDALKSGLVWNFLSILVLLALMISIVAFLVLYANPDHRFNPFFNVAAMAPELTLPVDPVSQAVARPSVTASITPTMVTPTVLPSETATKEIPAELPTVTNEPPGITIQVLEGNLTPAPTVKSDYPFTLRATPAAVNSTIIRSEEGCEWMGIGGQVYDLQGAPVVGLYIQLGGTLGGKTVDILSLTGTATQYGPAGYEIYLRDHPVPSRGTLWVQLFEQGGIPISPKTFFDTFDDCEKNLVLINFKQVR
jgi:hypothetical protein